MSNWQNFIVIILIQFVVFLAFLFIKKNANFTFKKFFASLVVGLVFGIAFDLIFGKLLGIFGYRMGFDWKFVVANGLLSYGIFAANVWLFRTDSFFTFYFQTIIIGAIYEIANHLFPVWFWDFGTGVLIEQLVLLFAAYFGLAFIISIIIKIITEQTFEFFTLK